MKLSSCLLAFLFKFRLFHPVNAYTANGISSDGHSASPTMAA
jgi:hypothetical protein